MSDSGIVSKGAEVSASVSTSAGKTPRELSLRHHQNRDLDGFVGMFAVDGVMELPFAFQGIPCRLADTLATRP